MALSNIFNEPRREITETVVGFLVFFSVGVGVHLGAVWWRAHELEKGGVISGEEFALMHVYVFLGLGVAMLVLPFVLVLIHTVGEGLCDWLGRRGLELRPKERYRKATD